MNLVILVLDIILAVDKNRRGNGIGEIMMQEVNRAVKVNRILIA